MHGSRSVDPDRRRYFRGAATIQRVRDRIGYLHVPKAAGTSVTEALVRAAAATVRDDGRAVTVCPAVTDRSLFGTFDDFGSLAPDQRSMVFRQPLEQLAGFDVVRGHFDIRSLRAGRCDDDVAVLLREPRARLLSLYTYWRSWTEAEHASWGNYDASRHATRLTWVEFLRDPSIAPQIDNVAARLVLGPHPLVPLDRFIPEANVAEVTDDALAALDGFGFVDVIENGPACWRRLGEWAELSLDVVARNETRSEDLGGEVWQGSGEPPALDALGRLTAIDHDLWTAAARRHTEDIDDLSARASSIAATKFASYGMELPGAHAVGDSASTRRSRGRAWWSRFSRGRPNR